jgi:hypothetical protein
VDDADAQYREPGDAITVYVPRVALPFFRRKFGDA